MKKIRLPQIITKINIPLLLFLIFFFNVKFIIKVIALVALIISNLNFKFGFSWKNSRLPLFYLAIILIETFKFLFLVRNYSINYFFVFCFGVVQWSMCLMAIHYLKLFIDKDGVPKMHQTIKAFFVINFAISMFFLILLLFFPTLLTYWGHGGDISFSHPSAGDTILGVTFDSSTVNATINSLGLIYFLYKKEYWFCFGCLVTIVLCTNNVAFALTVLMLILMFITVRSKQLRWRTFLAGGLLVTLYFFISKSNREYIRNYFVQLYILNKNPELATNAKPDSISIDTLISKDVASTKIGPPPAKKTTEVPKKVADTVYTFSKEKLTKAMDHFLVSHDTVASSFSEEDYNSKPGKLISFIQTYQYLESKPENLLFGSGIGRFSSKLAFRASGTGILGSYPKKYIYVAPEFKNNHLKSFLFYYNSDASKHSVLNYPFSVYNQILGEYGVVGMILFLMFYLGYFLRRIKHLTYGRYMTLILLGFFFMEYWFEFFSLIVLFELFVLLNIKEGEKV